MARLAAWMMAGLLACVASAAAQTPGTAPAAAGPVFAPVAHSALVAVEGAQSERTLLLRVRRVSDQQPLEGAALSVTLDGALASATQRLDGTWAVPLPEKPEIPGKLEIVVAHDGVREVLDGQLPVASSAAAASAVTAVPPPATGVAGKLSALIHKQGSWWVLNILIVLIGVIAISRRVS